MQRIASIFGGYKSISDQGLPRHLPQNACTLSDAFCHPFCPYKRTDLYRERFQLQSEECARRWYYPRTRATSIRYETSRNACHADFAAGAEARAGRGVGNRIRCGRNDRGGNFSHSSRNGEGAWFTDVAARCVGRCGRNVAERSTVLRRTRRAISAGRWNVYFLVGMLRREDRVPVWMDVLACYGAGTNGSICDGSRGICRLYFSLVAGANKARSHSGDLGIVCREHGEREDERWIFALDNVAEISRARDSDILGHRVSAGGLVEFCAICRAASRELCRWLRRWELQSCRRFFRLADGGTRRRSPGRCGIRRRRFRAR